MNRPLPWLRGPFCWLPGVVSQSVFLWDAVGLETAQGPKGHVRIALSPNPLL